MYLPMVRNHHNNYTSLFIISANVGEDEKNTSTPSACLKHFLVGVGWSTMFFNGVEWHLGGYWLCRCIVYYPDMAS